MPFAINITALGATAAPLRDLWAQFSCFEDTPSMAAFNYPPHVTLAIYDSIPADRLRDALHTEFAALPPFILRFSRLAFVEHPRLVFWARPDASELLAHVHAAIHRRIDPSLCLTFYRPQVWTPHCTLAMDVTPANKAAAIAQAASGIAPFEVVFDRADCAEFFPVRVIDEHALQTNGNGGSSETLS